MSTGCRTCMAGAAPKARYRGASRGRQRPLVPAAAPLTWRRASCLRSGGAPVGKRGGVGRESTPVRMDLSQGLLWPSCCC